jgi:hypothetical protein
MHFQRRKREKKLRLLNRQDLVKQEKDERIYQYLSKKRFRSGNASVLSVSQCRETSNER